MSTTKVRSEFSYHNTPLHTDDEETLNKDLLKPLFFNTPSRTNSTKSTVLKFLGKSLQVPDDKMAIMDELIHYFLNSSFIYDDMQDNTDMRYGKPTAHTVYGRERTILGLVYGMGNIMGTIEKFNNPKALELFKDMLPRMFAGHGMEIYRRYNNICPNEEEYYQTVSRLIGEPCLLLGKLMCLFSTGEKKDIEGIIKPCGVYFQMLNDYKNLRDIDYLESKGNSDDFSEGHFSFPIIYTINNFPKEGKILQDILQKRTSVIEERQLCLSLVEKCGGLEYTEQKLEELKEIILKEVIKFDDSPEVKLIFETVILSNTI